MLKRLLSISILLLPAVTLANDSAHEYRLENGLKIIVHEDHRAPVVVSQIWYKVGSSYEHDGITGVSHVLEHMMFKGTKKHAPGEFSRIIAENGGSENAFTSLDYTAYFQRLEKSRLPIAFELEADRMRGLLLPEEEFHKERQVVIEERRTRTEDKPTAMTYEQFRATAFTASPYRMPVIGWMNDLESMEVEDLRAWYQRWYAPNNATLVVAGDVVPEEVYALAKQHFGPLKPSDLKPLKPRIEPEQLGIRRINVKLPARQPYLLMGYKAPVLNTTEADWEPYALEVLAGILDGGDSARLANTLVRGSQIAASAGAGYGLYDRLSDLFLFDGIPAEGQSVEAVEQGLREQIEKIKNEPVGADEMKRVKAQVVAAAVYERDSIFYQAMQIGTLETIGLGWKHLDEYVERVRSITPAQVQQVAKKYLVDERLTVAVLDPQPMEQGKSRRPATAGGRHGG
ncbi:peptidase M16 [Solemya pervernicosa gill symbiont]|uniref:Peptidase M16 n=1 Tax=Solemya pervernicosa gill symbiont TaxID=642797 RepID=A0A1T2LB57_9GAMM|nr:pitrilysin family protein [Solemya pervernicosa gill symbiont]OOZ42327.1 peptidase M16 [Solemya pervernicosa gill symbiont]